MSCPSRNLEDNSSEKNMRYRGPAQMTSEGNNNNNWVRLQPSDISAKKGTAFSPYPENVSNEKLNNGVIFLAKEISRHPDIDCSMWSSAITL